MRGGRSLARRLYEETGQLGRGSAPASFCPLSLSAVTLLLFEQEQDETPRLGVVFNRADGRMAARWATVGSWRHRGGWPVPSALGHWLGRRPPYWNVSQLLNLHQHAALARRLY
jgi:hypothetical protein